MAQALALKYRPKSFNDLTEQEAVVTILRNQIETGTIKHGYLFVGAAGTGKTTSARIFANMINKGVGTPIELDAASNNSVDDIRELIENAQTKSLDSEYKVFIIDECHMITPQGWNAFLKTLEEPPLKSIFIMCTTNPEKIPGTILSRAQRYDFQKISQEGIVNRLNYILCCEEEQIIEEGGPDTVFDSCEKGAIEYIAKVADGGMRDAITMLDKCLSYSYDLTIENVVKALGVVDYDIMMDLTKCVLDRDNKGIIEIVNKVHSSGADLKQFIKLYSEFVLDINIYHITKDTKLIQVPEMWAKDFSGFGRQGCNELLDCVMKLRTSIKYEHNPKPVIIATLILFNKE